MGYLDDNWGLTGRGSPWTQAVLMAASGRFALGGGELGAGLTGKRLTQVRKLGVTVLCDSWEPHSDRVQREWCPRSRGDTGALKRLRQRVVGHRRGHTSDSEVFGKSFRGDDV